MALSWGAAGAADKSKVDGATKQVERGAKQIGQRSGRAGVQGDVYGRWRYGRRTITSRRARELNSISFASGHSTQPWCCN
jgi:hypothetical protein